MHHAIPRLKCITQMMHETAQCHTSSTPTMLRLKVQWHYTPQKTHLIVPFPRIRVPVWCQEIDRARKRRGERRRVEIPLWWLCWLSCLAYYCPCLLSSLLIIVCWFCLLMFDFANHRLFLSLFICYCLLLCCLYDAVLKEWVIHN